TEDKGEIFGKRVSNLGFSSTHLPVTQVCTYETLLKTINTDAECAHDYDPSVSSAPALWRRYYYYWW
ncbi:MAG: hypothetical protein ACREQ5_40520, partial [Candidatus Dormibacteria bacterium]